ncbi:MAG: PfkB family carbohydrate kinase [Candidatus Heimdallarchaeum endolithica]|uniref:PfkB family carbohydrate kinase n=1 Tax=Candidatus Heimdallarchaeum endolithica TaxID=2876572 RepID=A0A9Y1BTH4_9ARCH|nr:MAG: PfkB family carbohydrate kinase [Candidatus Heimdallarchaeum endolithica]
MNHKITLISHLVLDDKIFFKEDKVKEEYNQLGGPATYGLLVRPFIKQKIKLLTSCSKDFPISKIQTNPKNITVIPSKTTTRFKHEIFHSHRNLYLIDTAKELNTKIQTINTGKACLCSPVFKEISVDSVKHLTQNHEITVVDIQGFLRFREKNNLITFKFSKDEITEILKIADYVKLSYEEASIITQENTLTRIFTKLGYESAIITLGKEGVAYKEEKRIFKIQAPLVEEIDPTGAGDVFITAFLGKLIETGEIDYAVAFGIALASHAVTTKGAEPLPKVNYKEIADELLSTKRKIET